MQCLNAAMLLVQKMQLNKPTNPTIVQLNATIIICRTNVLVTKEMVNIGYYSEEVTWPSCNLATSHENKKIVIKQEDNQIVLIIYENHGGSKVIIPLEINSIITMNTVLNLMGW